VRLVISTLIGWIILGSTAGTAFAQDPVPAKPVDLFKDVRDLISIGKFELAADRLKAFRDANPSDADFLEIDRRFGAASFLKLKNVLKWDDNPTADAEAKKVVNDVITKSLEASTRLNRDPARIAKFVRNLGATPAEQAFAIDQLKLGEDAVVPVLISELRSTNEVALRTGIFRAMPQLPPSTVPGLLAAVEGVPDDQKSQMLNALAHRSDMLQLTDKADTDLTPLLWYYSASDNASLKTTATTLLDALVPGGIGRRTLDGELVRLSEPFAQRKAAFFNHDRMLNKVKVSTWDRERQAVRTAEVPLAVAEEYYGLRNLKWATERVPQSEVAQAAFLGLATERAVIRANFTDLSKKEPAVYRLLAGAPDSILSTLLDTAIAENRTALAVGVLQAMGDRGQKDTPGVSGKSSPYSRALNYSDPRVQLAAAVAILRSPEASPVVSRSRVVDILQRSLTADLDGAAEGKTGRAIIADPDANRAAKLMSQFQEIGYAAERFANGRDLLRRVQRAADFDLIVLDRHVANPLVTDVISQLVADPNSGRHPILVIASSDQVKPVPVETLLLRLAILVSATETDESIQVPPPYVFNPKLPDLDRAKARADNVKIRELEIKSLAKLRLSRLQRLVESAGLSTDRAAREWLDLRLPQLTYAVIAAEHYVSKDSAPEAAQFLEDLTTRLRKQPLTNNPLARAKATTNLNQILLQLDSTLDADRRKKFDLLQQQITPESVAVDVGSFRDEALERQLAKQVKGYLRVSVIPESLSSAFLAQDVKSTATDPNQLPTTREEKKAGAKLAAEWLKKIATGAVTGYDAKPAEAALRSALRSDDLAPDAMEALTKLGSGDSQVALVSVAAASMRPVALRLQAVDAAIRHSQAFGKLTPAAVVDQLSQASANELDLTLQGKLAVLANILSAKSSELGTVIRRHPVTLPPPPKPQEPTPPAKPPEEPKKG
jgi:CheY-like chemotaxis protein